MNRRPGIDVDAVVLDLDGTLFDHRGAALEGVTAWLSRLGMDARPELISLWFEAEARFLAAWHRGELDWRGQRRARIRHVLGELGRDPGDDAALDVSFAVYLAGYERAWRAFADAAPALSRLTAAGLAVAVLSNGADDQQRAKLSACSLTRLVDRVFCSDTIGFAKPDRRSYLYVCERLQIDPARSLHIGDRYDLDVIGARDAGLQAVHLDRIDEGPIDEPLRIASLAELPALLGVETDGG